MVAESGLDTNEATNLVVLLELLELLGERKVGESVAVIGQEYILPLEVLLHCFQALADVGVDARIYKGDLPIVDILIEQLKLSAATGQDKVIGDVFAVVQKISLDSIGPIAKAEDKVFVSKVRIVFHYVPQNWTITDMYHRLGRIFRIVANPHAQSAAKQYYFHTTPPTEAVLIKVELVFGAAFTSACSAARSPLLKLSSVHM